MNTGLMIAGIIFTCVLIWVQCFFSGKAVLSVLGIREGGWAAPVVTGLGFSLAVFQIVSVPLICLKVPTHVLTIVAAVLWLGSAAYGVWRFVREIRERKGEQEKKRLPWVFLLVTILAVGSASLSMVYEHEDWDDAEVVSLVTDAVQNDQMLLHHRELGKDVPLSSNIKRVVSPYQMWEAVLSQLSRIHPAILCHTLMPFFLIISAFLVFYCLGMEVFGRDMEKTGIFLLFLAAIYLVGSYSTRNGQFFFLVRSWQGKAMIQALVVPMVLHRLFFVMHYSGERRRWLLILMSVFASCVFSNTSFLTTTLVVAAGTLYIMLRERRVSPLLYGLLSASPCALYGGILAGVTLL
ncbi:MAG: hypothetical protein IJT05_03735 [Lachnospiraceae bacterium]|nr:hypothetical protein [Lachnospiraceae bacterium]